MNDGYDAPEAPKPKKIIPQPAAPGPTINFRVHFRSSVKTGTQTMDVSATNIGDAHKQVKDEHGGEGVRLIIDKTKVLGKKD